MDRGLIKQAIFSYRMHCAECGNVLNIKEGNMLSEAAKYEQNHFPQGDAMTFIEPCKSCIEKETAPARAIKAALAAI